MVLLPETPSDGDRDLETSALAWTSRAVVSLRSDTQVLKPNTVFFFRGDAYGALLPIHRLKSASVQVLEDRKWNSQPLNQIAELQVLLDEGLSKHLDEFRQRHGLRVSDVAPSTSFASLSVEFFAKVRKAA